MAATIDTLEKMPATGGDVEAGQSLPDLPQPTAPSGMKFTYASGTKPLAGFTIKRGVGIGGFGEVYFALSDAGKEVALKRVQRNLEIELRGVSQCLNLKHPNLISLFDIRYDDAGEAWIVMEYVAGESLRAALDHAPNGLSKAEVRRWFAALAAGVAHLHDAGVVHRDLKPANIFDDEGIVKIGDYGLSKFISCSRRGGHTESVGTFHYMAPEVGRGSYGREIDIYALGIILYELLTGRVPFDGESSHEIVMKHLTADPDLSDVAEPYRSVIRQAMQKDPARRQRTVVEMLRPLGIEMDSHGIARELVGATQRRGEASADRGEGGILFGEVRHHTPVPVPPAAVPGGGAVGLAGRGALTARREEPLARAVRSSLRGLGRWWNGLESFPGTRLLLLLMGVVLVLLNTQWLLPLLALLAVLYVPYYVIRAMVLGAPPQPSFAEAHQTAVAQSRRPRPLSRRQWQEQKRAELAAKHPATRLGELGGSLSTAALAATVLAGLAAAVGLWERQPTSMAVAPFAWSAAVAAIGAGVVLGLGKLWERENDGGLSRRLVMLGAGAAVGATAFVLADYVMLPLSEGLSRDIHATELPVALYDSAGVPQLAALMAHFALLFAALRWWRVADPLRRSRFSLWAVAVAVVGEWALHQVLPAPQPWGMLTAGLLAAVVQLSAPWEDPRQRLRHGRLVSVETV